MVEETPKKTGPQVKETLPPGVVFTSRQLQQFRIIARIQRRQREIEFLEQQGFEKEIKFEQKILDNLNKQVPIKPANLPVFLLNQLPEGTRFETKIRTNFATQSLTDEKKYEVVGISHNKSNSIRSLRDALNTAADTYTQALGILNQAQGKLLAQGVFNKNGWVGKATAQSINAMVVAERTNLFAALLRDFALMENPSEIESLIQIVATKENIIFKGDITVSWIMIVPIKTESGSKIEKRFVVPGLPPKRFIFGKRFKY